MKRIMFLKGAGLLAGGTLISDGGVFAGGRKPLIKVGIIGNFGATCGNAYDGYLFKIKGTKGTISLLTDRGVFLPEKNTAPKNELIDGVTGASKIVWSKEGGAPILPEPTKDGTWYALIDFYKAISSGRLPDSNVYTGARTAICVDLANQALYGQKVMHWSKEASAVLPVTGNQQM